MRELADGHLVGRKANKTGVHDLEAIWNLREGYAPIVLQIQRWDVGAAHSIELRCGEEGNVVGTELGEWRYYCAEARADSFKLPFGGNFSDYATFEELKAAVMADVRAYLAGEHKYAPAQTAN